MSGLIPYTRFLSLWKPGFFICTSSYEISCYPQTGFSHRGGLSTEEFVKMLPFTCFNIMLSHYQWTVIIAWMAISTLSNILIAKYMNNKLSLLLYSCCFHQRLDWMAFRQPSNWHFYHSKNVTLEVKHRSYIKIASQNIQLRTIDL